MGHMSMKKIVIVGGSGFVGSRLAGSLLERNYEVVIVDLVAPRLSSPTTTVIIADVEKSGVPEGVLDGAYAVINLAGAPISKRWTDAYKRVIVSSRVNVTRSVVSAMRASPTGPRILVSASAVGWYGDGGESVLREDALAGHDFLASVCFAWEGAAMEARGYGIRVAVLRTAHVMGGGGILAQLAPLFKARVGGYFGNGNQYMPWVHIDDLVSQYVYALEHDGMSGAYNTSAGEPVTQKRFMRAVASAVGTRICWRIPRFIALVALGDFGNSLCTGQKTDSSKIRGAGFSFVHENLEEAVERFVK
jgi:hypothetical protein